MPYFDSFGQRVALFGKTKKKSKEGIQKSNRTLKKGLINVLSLSVNLYGNPFFLGLTISLSVNLYGNPFFLGLTLSLSV